MPKIDNAGGSEPCAKGTCQVYEYIITTNTFTTKACGEVFIIRSGPLAVTEKRFFTFWEANFVMILSMLEELKQAFVFGLSCLCVSHFSNKVTSQSSIPLWQFAYKVNENASVVYSVFLFEKIGLYFYNY